MTQDIDQFNFEAIFPNWYNEQWVSYTVKSILEGIASDRIRIGATVMAKGANVKHSYVHAVFPRLINKYLGQYITPINFAYRSAAKRLAKNDVAYFWLEGPSEFSNELRSRGVMVVREMINCTLELRRKELRRAYEMLGMPDGSNISDADIKRERNDLLAADMVFCPNPYVLQSVLAYGVAPERCVKTSYGWSANRLHGDTVAVPRDGTFTVAFVGTIDIRKGAPVLLEAWSKAGIRGRLLLAGALTPEVRSRYSDVLNRPDVQYLGHVEDVGSVYRSADVFCFPSWEEGGPLVTIEAMALGNVPVVTGMGTSGTFSEGEEVGIVVPPGDVDALIRALQLLANEPERRRHYSEAARERSKAFSWDVVGRYRREALVQHRRAWLERMQQR